MNRENVELLMRGTETHYIEFSKHEPLIGLACVFEDEEGDTELTYAVPELWLLNLMKFKRLKDLRDWLKNEYTSDESRQVLGEAILHNKVAFYNFR